MKKLMKTALVAGVLLGEYEGMLLGFELKK